MGLVVLDRGTRLEFGFDDLMRYHGPGSPGGVAHAYKVLERALPLLGEDPPERREVEVATAFGGPGARDGFELVLRAVTEGRYTVDPGARAARARVDARALRVPARLPRARGRAGRARGLRRARSSSTLARSEHRPARGSTCSSARWPSA